MITEKQRKYHTNYMRKWRLNNPEKNILISKKSDAKRKEWNRVRALKYMNAHKKERAIYAKKWRDKNPDYYKNWNKNNIGKRREYEKTQRIKHPEYIKQKNIMRYARKHGAVGKFTVKDWEKIKKKYNYTCPHCKKKEPEIKLTKDHIIPLTKGGTNWIINIQPLCHSCNSKKGAKVGN